MLAAPLTLRLLSPADRPAILRHLARLGPEQARLRFGHSPTDSSLASYLKSLDFDRDALFGAVDDASGEMFAFAQMAQDPEPGCGELGLSVELSCQGLGLGKALLGRALALARDAGFHSLIIHCSWDNAPMLALGRLAQGRIERNMGEMCFVLNVEHSLGVLGSPSPLWGPWKAPLRRSVKAALHAVAQTSVAILGAQKKAQQGAPSAKGAILIPRNDALDPSALDEELSV